MAGIRPPEQGQSPGNRMTESRRVQIYLINGWPGCLRGRINPLTQEKKMKKIIVLFAAAMLLFGFSGQAMAYFADGDLIRVVYDSATSTEVATDLGALSSFSSTPTTVNTVGQDFTLSMLGASSFSALNVAYFVNNTATNELWTSGPTTSQTSGSNKYGQFNGAAGSVESLYALLGTQQGTESTTNGNGYYAKMDLVGTNKGSFAAFITLHNGEQVLTALGTTGSVDQHLYYYTDP